jgi:hypothetical protein
MNRGSEQPRTLGILASPGAAIVNIGAGDFQTFRQAGGYQSPRPTAVIENPGPRPPARVVQREVEHEAVGYIEFEACRLSLEAFCFLVRRSAHLTLTRISAGVPEMESATISMPLRS